MNNIEIIGIVAGAFSTFAPASQMIKTLKTKHADDVSALMFVSFLIGNVLWCIYGYLMGAISVILWNFLGICGNLIALFMKNRYSKKENRVL